jgi:shikimate kinase
MSRNLIHPDGTVLIGMMGSGKSSQGERLHEYLGQPLIDTDPLIVQHSGRAIIDLVNDGVFPQEQTDAVMSIKPKEPSIIPTGGSVPLYDELMKHLSQYGKIVYLEVDPDILMARILKKDPDRIKALNSNGGSFLDVYRKRMPIYRSWADYTLEIGDEPKETTQDRIRELRSK